MTEEAEKRNWLQDWIFRGMGYIIAVLIAFGVNSILYEIRSVKIDLKEVITIMQGQINNIRHLQESRKDRVINILGEHNTKIELTSERTRQNIEVSRQNSERIKNLEKAVFK